MKKLLFLVFALVFTLGVFSVVLQADELSKEHLAGTVEPAGVSMAAVTDGPARIDINPYGTASRFQFGDGPNHLFEFLNFISINNGPIQLVSPTHYTVNTPVQVMGRTGYSAVTHDTGDLFIEYYQTIVNNGDGLMDWYIELLLWNVTDRRMNICYYPYLDLDLFGVAEDTVARAGRDPEFDGALSFRLSDLNDPSASFVLVDIPPSRAPNLRPDSFEMRPFPQVRNRLSSAQTCITLPNELANMTGDFTGTMRYTTTIMPNDSLSIAFLVSRLD
jgi:hypothetical protein